MSSNGAEWQQNLSHVSRPRGNFSESPGNRTLTLPGEDMDALGGHAMWQVVIIVFLTGSLSLVTVVGNILVLVSFKVNKALKTVNNYYLLSLAFADLTLGTLSMNLYTTYIILGQWTLGPVVCDLWLTVDYVASNASVMNLLVISFDRYFSVTRPLTYRAKRTTKRAMIMIGLAWSVSFVLWAPAILCWQYVVGERTVQANECYIQFLSEPIITFCTAIAAFYLPVTIMTILFWKIYQETEKRAKDVQGLKGSGSGTGNQESSAMLRQMSLQSSSSYESNRPTSEKKKKKKDSGSGLRGKCGSLCLQVSSLLPRHRASARSDNTNVTTVSEAECFHDNKSVCQESPKKSKQVTDEETKSSIKSPNKPQPNAASSSSSSSSSSAPITMKDATMAKRFASKARAEITKRKNERKANDKKAARTLSAILLAFITTWLPYNIMVLVNTFCQDCIPETLWALGYWLCYVNSTVNPVCYALCNKTFRTTFRDVLLCRWNQRKNQANFQEKKVVAFRKKELM